MMSLGTKLSQMEFSIEIDLKSVTCSEDGALIVGEQTETGAVIDGDIFLKGIAKILPELADEMCKQIVMSNPEAVRKFVEGGQD